MNLKKPFTSIFFATVLSAVMIVGTTQPVSAKAVAQASPTPKASAKPKASPSPSPELDTTQKLKDRIDKVINQRREQVQGIVDQITMQRRGFIGEVQRVTEKTVTVRNRRGTQILTITPEVVLLKDNKKITIDDIAVSDWVIAMGYVDKDEFSLRRLVVSSTSLRPRSFQTIVGTLTNLTTTQVSIQNRLNRETKTFTTTKTTVYQDDQGNTIDRKALVKDTQYLIIGTEEKDVFTATIIRSLAPTK